MNEFDTYSDELMGFVLSCLFCGAISRDEFRDWCMQAVTRDGAPSFLYDLIDFEGEIFKIYQVIGRTPYWKHSNEEDQALYEIAVRRGRAPYDMPISLDDALGKLNSLPAIGEMFQNIFGFTGIEKLE